MLSLKCVIVFSVVAAVYSAEIPTKKPAFDKLRCPNVNEVWATAGPGCPQTCDNLNVIYNSLMAGPPGCYCLDGYVRDRNNKCVIGNLYCGGCVQTYEYYLANGPSCDANCSTIGQKCPEVAVDDDFGTYSGCFCMEGYARGPLGYCIPIERCPVQQCNFGEEYRTCGPCEGSCDDPHPICTDDKCKPAGCYCKSDFVRHENGPCVRYYARDMKCKRYEVYARCFKNEGTCDNPNVVIDDACAMPGCYCPPPNFVRNENGTCQPTERCPNYHALFTDASSDQKTFLGVVPKISQAINTAIAAKIDPAQSRFQEIATAVLKAFQ